MPGEQVGSAYATIGLDGSMLDQGLSKAKSAFKSGASEIQGMAMDLAGGIENAMKKAAEAVVAVGIAFTALSIHEVADFQGEIYELGRNSGLTAEAIQKVTDANRELSDSSTVSRDALDEVSASMSLLIKDADGIIAITKNIDEFSMITGVAAKDAAELDLQIGRIWSEGAPGLAKLNDAAIALHDTIGSNETATLSFVASFGPLAQTVGETDTRTEAFGATLSALGIDGSAAMMEIYNATTALNKNVATLTDSADNMTKATKKAPAAFTEAALEAQDKLKDLSNVFGESAEQIAEDINKDYYGTLVKLGGKLRENSSDTEGLAAATALFGARGVKILMQLGDHADVYNKALLEVGDSTDIAAKKAEDMAEKQTEIWTKVKEIMNTVYDAALAFGKELEPYLGPILDRVKSLATEIKDAFEGKISWIQVGRDVTAALSDGIKAAWDESVKIGEWIKGVVTTWISAGGANWLGTTIAQDIGIAIEAAADMLWKIGDWINKKVLEWGPKGGEATGKEIGTWIGGAIAAVLESGAGSGTSWSEIGTAIIKGIGEGLQTKLPEILNDLRDAFIEFSGEVAGVFAQVGNDIISMFNGILTSIQTTVNATGQIMLGTYKTDTSATKNSLGQTVIEMYGKAGEDYGTASSEEEAKSYIHSKGGGYYNAPTGGQVTVESLGYSGMYSVQSSAYDSTSGLVWEDNGISTPSSATVVNSGQTTYNAFAPTGTTVTPAKPIEETQADQSSISAAGTSTGVSGLENYVTSGYTNAATSLAEYQAPQLGYYDVAAVVDKAKKDAADIWPELPENAAKEAAKITTDAAKDQEGSTKKIVDMMTAGTITSAGKTIQAATQAGYVTQQYTAYSATAMKLGAEIGAKFTTDGGNAVKIGLTESGQQIAIIGSVAQKNFSDAGGQFVTDSGTGGKKLVDSSATAGKTTTDSATASGTVQKGAATTAATATTGASQTFQQKINAGAQVAMDAISKAGDPATKLVIGANYAAQALVSAGQSLLSMVRSAGSYYGSYDVSKGRDAGGWGYYAEGTITNGPQLAVIGEEGKEFVIPTKQKRWDLLYAAMRAYGIRGFAEGGDVGSSDTSSDIAKTIASITLQWDVGKLVKDTESKLKNLQDYFKTTWLLIQSRSQMAWINIKSTVVPAVDSFAASLYNDMSGIRTNTISTWQTITAAISTQVAAIWPTISPNIISIHDNVINSFSEVVSAIATLMDSMKSQMATSLQDIVSEWGTEFSEITNSVTTMTTSITGLSTQLTTLIGLVNQLNSLGISLGGSIGGNGGGSSGGTSTEYMGMGSEDNVVSSSFAANPGDIQDMTCTGPVSINTLHYTSPTGETIDVNPMTYLSTGLTALTASVQSAVSTAKAAVTQATSASGGWSTAGGYAASGGISEQRYGLNAFGDAIHSDEFASWGKYAKGGIAYSRQFAMVAEEGPELILNAELTRRVMDMTDRPGGGGLAQVEVYLDSDRLAGKLMTKAVKRATHQGGMRT